MHVLTRQTTYSATHWYFTDDCFSYLSHWI